MPDQLCPMCGQTIRERGRICASCQKPIGRHDKFYFDGSTVRHRNCQEPTQYRPSGNGYHRGGKQ